MKKKTIKSVTNKLRRANIKIALRNDSKSGKLIKAFNDSKSGKLIKAFTDKHNKLIFCLADPDPTLISNRIIQGCDNSNPNFNTLKYLSDKHRLFFIKSFDHRLTTTSTSKEIDAKQIIDFLLYYPTHDENTYTDRLLLSINPNRPKEDILNEIEILLNIHLQKKKTRLSWLNKCELYFEVWDEWLKMNISSKKCFPLIARKLKTNVNTVKSRWYKAYKIINGKPYDIKEMKAIAKSKGDELCINCKDASCYKEVSGSMKHIPCPAFLRLAGKEYQRERSMTDKEFSIYHFGEMLDNNESI